MDNLKTNFPQTVGSPSCQKAVDPEGERPARDHVRPNRSTRLCHVQYERGESENRMTNPENPLSFRIAAASGATTTAFQGPVYFGRQLIVMSSLTVKSVRKHAKENIEKIERAYSFVYL